MRAVLFDFAGTLFDDRALRDAHLRQLRFVARAAGVEATDAELRAAYRQGMGVAYRAVAVQASYRHRTLFRAAFAATAVALGGTIDEATADEAVDRQYRATIEEAVLRPDCLETLATLQRSSIHVQIVSNIDDEQFEPMLERLDLFRVIDAWTSSEQADSCKPDPAIYRLALTKAASCRNRRSSWATASATTSRGRPRSACARHGWHLGTVPTPAGPPRRRDHGIGGGARPRRSGCGPMTEERLEAYLDDALGDRIPLRVTPMVGGGSCEVFAVDRGPDRWVLRRAPKHASSSTAHDVLREFRILDAIKDTSVPIARPVVACGDPEVFGAPFYVMERIEGKPVLKAVPEAWAAAPEITRPGARGARRRPRGHPRRRLARLRPR